MPRAFNLVNFEETVYKHEIDRDIEIIVTFAIYEEDRERLKEEIMADSIEYSIKISKYRPIRENIKVDPFEIEFDGEELHHNIPTANLRVRTFKNAPLSWTVKGDKSQLVENIKEIIKEKFRDIYYISDKRGILDTYYGIDEEPKDVGFAGENSIVKLHYIYSDRSEAFNKIEQWIKRLDPEIQMIKSPVKHGRTTIELKTIHGDINLLSGGYGLNTVFPIIMQTIISPFRSIILIEEPEIHLHKGAQKIIFC